MAAPSDIDGENAEDVGGQVQEAPIKVVQESWVKEFNQDSRYRWLLCQQYLHVNHCFSKEKSRRGKHPRGKMKLIFLSKRLSSYLTKINPFRL